MVKIADIKIGSRARQATGWLDDLQRSIDALGVLQPIGVTPGNELIFGYRRLMACKALGFEEIPARIIDIDADDPVTALRMEQAENEVRKDFTPSEKVEIARRIEEALASRNGVRRDSKSASLKLDELPEGRSDELAAESVGWGKDTYRKAKAVVDSGNEDAKAAMDSGEESSAKRRNPAKFCRLTTRQFPRPRRRVSGLVW